MAKTKKYMIKVVVEGYVWLEADNPKQALFLAQDIAGMKEGLDLGAHCNDIEVINALPVELHEVSDLVGGATNTSVEL